MRLCGHVQHVLVSTLRAASVYAQARSVYLRLTRRTAHTRRKVQSGQTSTNRSEEGTRPLGNCAEHMTEHTEYVVNGRLQHV